MLRDLYLSILRYRYKKLVNLFQNNNDNYDNSDNVFNKVPIGSSLRNYIMNSFHRSMERKIEYENKSKYNFNILGDKNNNNENNQFVLMGTNGDSEPSRFFIFLIPMIGFSFLIGYHSVDCLVKSNKNS